MIYLLGFGAALIQIAMSDHWSLWGGQVYILPVLLLVSASLTRWRSWLVWFAALGVTLPFVPLSPLALGSLIALSFAISFIFQRWIDLTNIWLMTLVSLLLILCFITIAHLPDTLAVFPILGSLVVVAPLIWFGYSVLAKERRL